MNINFLSKCLVVNHCKRHLNKKTVYLDFNRKHFLTSDRTSNNKRNFLSCDRIPLNNNITKRFCSSQPQQEDRPREKRLPPLMQFPEIFHPSVIKTMKNFYLTTFIIKPYFDKEFDILDFISGSKKALEVVSTKISEGDFASLDGLVVKDAIEEIRKSISTMSLSQRMQIAINQDDIYLSIPYQIKVTCDDNNDADKVQKRFVEIMMLFQTFRGLKDMKNRGEKLPLNVVILPEYQDNVSICNYSFKREFTEGVESDWIINLLNHLKPSDYMFL